MFRWWSSSKITLIGENLTDLLLAVEEGNLDDGVLVMRQEEREKEEADEHVLADCIDVGGESPDFGLCFF